MAKTSKKKSGRARPRKKVESTAPEQPPTQDDPRKPEDMPDFLKGTATQ